MDFVFDAPSRLDEIKNLENSCVIDGGFTVEYSFDRQCWKSLDVESATLFPDDVRIIWSRWFGPFRVKWHKSEPRVVATTRDTAAIDLFRAASVCNVPWWIRCSGEIIEALLTGEPDHFLYIMCYGMYVEDTKIEDGYCVVTVSMSGPRCYIESS